MKARQCKLLSFILSSLLLTTIFPFQLLSVKVPMIGDAIAAQSSSLTEEQTTTRSEELKIAAQDGFDAVKASDQSITGNQFMDLLDQYIEKMDNEKSDEWLNLLPNLRISDAPLQRSDAFVALYLAAETIGGHWMDLDNDWADYHQKIGEGAWDTYSPSVSLLGQDVLDAVSPVGEFGWPRAAASYFFSFGRHSLLSGEKIFDYDSVTNSMNPDLPLTCSDALLAVSRLCFSNPQIAIPRTTTQEDLDILAKAEERKQRILNSESDYTVKGKAKVYYVSNSGSDANDGQSPQTAWATLDKVNSAAITKALMWDNTSFPEYLWASKNKNKCVKLKKGDAVLFERGSEWRGVLRTVEGVTYSAYGTGDKPVIMGSPENGSGAEKWKLIPGSKNVWVFYKPMQDCGGILLDNSSVAQKYTAYWNGRKYIDVGEGQFIDAQAAAQSSELEIASLPDLRFFNDIQYSNDLFDFGMFGSLYFSCAAGNPGEVYDSIEFFTGNNSWNEGLASAKNGTTLDNLCFQYSATGIGAQSVSNATIQNCVVAYGGGIIQQPDGILSDSDDRVVVMRCGDGISIGGKNNRAINNYVSYIYDNGIAVESYSAESDPAYSRRSDCLISGNLVANCGGGLLCTDWNAWLNNKKSPVFKNIQFDDNYVLYTGLGWTSQRDIEEQAGALAAIGVWINAGSRSVTFSNNVVYLTNPLLGLIIIGTSGDSQKALSLDKNTYVQNNIGIFCTRYSYPTIKDKEYTTAIWSYGLNEESVARSVLMDLNAVVLPVSFGQ